MSLFQKAEEASVRLKTCIYGKSGIGKTFAALQFPNPVVIDFEKGTVAYGGQFEFSVLKTQDPKVAEDAVKELLEDPQGYKTIVVDPISIYCDLVTEAQLRKLRKMHGQAYELRPPDYRPIKNRIRNFVRNLLALDMNVVVTARTAEKYAEGEFMKVIGARPDMHKEIPYMFDTVIYLSRKGGKRWAITDEDASPDFDIIAKDRTRLPAEFEFSYSELVKHWGEAGLIRDAEPVTTEQAPLDETVLERDVEIELANGSTLLTAGVTGEQVDAIQEAAKDSKIKADIKAYIMENYGIDSVLDLREDEAEEMLTALGLVQTN